MVAADHGVDVKHRVPAAEHEGQGPVDVAAPFVEDVEVRREGAEEKALLALDQPGPQPHKPTAEACEAASQQQEFQSGHPKQFADTAAAQPPARDLVTGSAQEAGEQRPGSGQHFELAALLHCAFPGGSSVDARDEVHEVLAALATANHGGFDGEAHGDVGGGEVIADEPEMLGKLYKELVGGAGPLLRLVLPALSTVARAPPPERTAVSA